MKSFGVLFAVALAALSAQAKVVEVTIPNNGTPWATVIAGAEINEGDILQIGAGDNLTSYSLGGWESPKLAGLVFTGNCAQNFSAGTFNLKEDATIEVQGATRVILNTVQLNPASPLNIEKTGAGKLQFLGVQSCPALKLTITGGDVYVHQDAALGAVPVAQVADAITLNGGTLYNGFSNTALGTVVLAATRGITIPSGKTGKIGIVATEVAGLAYSDFVIKGPIAGDGNLSLAPTSGKTKAGNPVYLTIAGKCMYAGSTTIANQGHIAFEPGGSLPAATTLSSNGAKADTLIDLNGTSQTVGILGNNNFTLVGSGLFTVADRTAVFPAPACGQGAAIAIDASECETALSKIGSSYAVVDVNGKVVKLLDKSSYGAANLPKIFEFRFSEACSNEAAYVAVSEIELTKDGVPIDRSCYDLSKCTASSEGAGKPVANLFDSCGNTYWTSAVKPTANNLAVVRVVLKGASAGIDGYRLGAGDKFDCSTNPKSWQVVEIGANGQETVLDTKTNVNLAPRHSSATTVGFAGNLSVNFTFSGAVSSDIGTGLEIGPNATYLVGAGDAQTVGKLTGAGTLSLGAGAVATGDLSEFAGDVKATGEATLLLAASAHACATTVGSSAVAYGAAVSGVNVLIDDQSGTAPLRGKLTGSIGLVKSGEGERTLQTERSDNTGKVLVEGGTLTVSAARSVPETTVTARYIQFVPLQNASKNTSAGINVSLNEFELLDENGEKVAWPSGKTILAPKGVTTAASGTSTSDIVKIIDGNIATRCFLNSTGTDIVLSPFTVDTKTGVTFAKYRWYTAMNTSNSSYNSDKGRTPVEWEIRVSDDNETWRTVHHGTGDVNDYGSDTTDWKDANGFLRGPFALDLAGSFPAPEFGALPADMVVKGDAADTVAAAVKARYLRFMPYGTVAKAVGKNITINDNFGCAFSEFDLYRNGTRIEWSGASASVPNYYEYQGQPANAVDNVFDNTGKRFYSRVFPFDVIIDAGEDQTVEFDAYGFHNDTANGARRPDSWKLWVSNDKENWHLVDDLKDQTSDSTKTGDAGHWSIAGKLAVTNTFTTTAIGDSAPVEIAAGATLKLDTDCEKFGALSGEGTLELVRGAKAVVNAAMASDTNFCGAVTGGGTLAVAGGAAQVFGGADLSGVSTLDLTKGSVAGSADFGGNDLTVAFGSGDTGLALPQLTNIGKLTITGDVKIVIPADTPITLNKQVLRWTSSDEASLGKLRAATIVNHSTRKTDKFRIIVDEKNKTLTVAYHAGSLLILE